MTTLLREMIKSRAAIECFLLVAFLAHSIFQAFLARNVKPAARQSKTQIFWAQLITAELYGDLTPTGILPWVYAPFRSARLHVSGILIAVFLPALSSGGAADTGEISNGVLRN